MAAAKKPARKRRISANDVDVDGRRLTAVLAELAELNKECAVRSARAEEIAAEALKRLDRTEVRVDEALARLDRTEARTEEAMRRLDRTEEALVHVMKTSSAQVLKLESLSTEMREAYQDLHAWALRAEERFAALEKPAAE
jgi:hypothetical protein